MVHAAEEIRGWPALNQAKRSGGGREWVKRSRDEEKEVPCRRRRSSVRGFQSVRGENTWLGLVCECWRTLWRSSWPWQAERKSASARRVQPQRRVATESPGWRQPSAEGLSLDPRRLVCSHYAQKWICPHPGHIAARVEINVYWERPTSRKSI